jgi:hypothetical protein
MRSSEIGPRVTTIVSRLAIAASVLAFSCSPAPSAGVASPDCTSADASAPPQAADALTELRRSVEAGPFYALASRSGVASCRVTRDADAITLDYSFRDGASLHVTRNPQTEYTDQEVRLASPLDESPVDVLMRAERATFDAKGCGINWRRLETSQPTDEPGATDSIYRGDVCNCQARARSDAAGRVLRLQFRSAC